MRVIGQTVGITVGVCVLLVLCSRNFLLLLQVIYSSQFTHSSCTHFHNPDEYFSTPHARLCTHYFSAHLGSVCKLAAIRLTLPPFIFLLILIRPSHRSSATACLCMCGYALNMGYRYSLPVLAYQSAIAKPISLSQAA